MGAQAMPSSGAISRQGSLCGLTLSEVEGQLHSVNLEVLDDLLRTAGSAAAARKTVDEVWRDIQGTAGGRFLRPPPAQMTLEDFLSRSGDVVAAAADADAGSGGVGARWAQQYHPPPDPPRPPPGQERHNVGRPQQPRPPPGQERHNVRRTLLRPLGVGAGPVLDALYHEGASLAGRKRGIEDGPAEKTVERRKKRMIKNRESAARSRARKQAYTNELENKISRLEEENERLKRDKAFEPVVHYVPQQDPKNQLRRINSASF